MRAPTPRHRRSALRHLLTSEAGGGLVLMAAAAVALIIANSPAAPLYFDLLNANVLGLSILHWINDALMAVFFLLVGLEIKREMQTGELSTWPRRALPGFSALGGIVVPALIYAAFNASTPQTLRGWAIPSSTDIAFALGVLSLLGSRVPVSLKLFLTALAILDDLGAVLIIALVYTSDLDVRMLALAGVTILVLVGLNRWGVNRLWPYIALGVVLWLFFYKSGMHATLAGVSLASTIPLRHAPGRLEVSRNALISLEHALQPWVAYLVLPVFAFANAGMVFSRVKPSALLEPLPLGIALGLFLGKQLGVSIFAWAAIRTGLADLPRNATWPQLYGIAILCGIGFTMSLFVGLLAFPAPPELQDMVKTGVLAGSSLSAVFGAALLLAIRPQRH